MKYLCVCWAATLSVASVCLATGKPTNPTANESSSLFRRAAAGRPLPAIRPVSDRVGEGGVTFTNASLFAVKPLPKRVYKVHDLITVIVRQKSTYKHKGKTDLERDIAVEAELRNWIRFKSRRLIPASMPEGTPKIDFKLNRKFEGDGEKQRSDEVVSRITCKIIDVKPNGNLVIEGKDRVTTDGETQKLTIRGTCRSEDVNADNTILSTQIADLVVDRDSGGAVRDAMRRGWLYKLWDKIRPF